MVSISFALWADATGSFAAAVDYAVQLAASSGLPVAPVGQIADAVAVEAALDAGVEVVPVGRALHRDPYFKLRLDGSDPKALWPSQYSRALI